MKTYMKYASIFSSALIALSLTTACSSEDIVEAGDFGTEKIEGMPMKFNVSEAETRTEYFKLNNDDYKELGLRWTEGDNVLIFCDQAKGTRKKSVYHIEDLTDNNKSGKLNSNGTDLVYDDNASTKHHIHAVYPGDENKVSYANGIATLSLNTSVQKEWEGTASTGYNVKYDMKDAYMVASKNNHQRAAETTLHFDPIMSTFKVVVTNNYAGASDAYVSGVTLSFKNTAGYVKDGKIQYNFADGKLEPFADANKAENIKFNIELRKGSDNFVKLAPNEKIEMMFFLPPLPDVSTSNPIDIYVRATEGMSRNVQVTRSEASSKKLVTITVGKCDPDQWIKYIDDDVYVSQLSIPGVGYAGTCSNSDENGKLGSFGGYAIQGYRTSKLWDYGCRAFDFHGNKSLRAQIASLTIAQDETIFDIMNTLDKKLEQYPEEFAIVFVRQEFNKTTAWEWDYLRDAYWDSGVKHKKGNYTRRAIKFRPDLTVGEMRGKILLIGIDWDNPGNVTLSGTIKTNDWPTRYYTSNCYYEDVVKTNGKITGFDASQTATLYAQEFLNININPSRKIDVTCELLDKTNQVNKDDKLANVWSINAFYCSMYTQWSSNNFAIGQANAIYTLPNANIRGSGKYSQDYVYSYFMKSQNWGPCGIILQAFTGLRSVNTGASTYPVFGDLLNQAIIDRNFINDLKKKPKSN